MRQTQPMHAKLLSCEWKPLVLQHLLALCLMEMRLSGSIMGIRCYDTEEMRLKTDWGMLTRVVRCCMIHLSIHHACVLSYLWHI